MTPSTLEAGLTGYASVQTGNHAALALTTYGAQLLAGRTGAQASVIQSRFSGRVSGKQTVDDRGRRADHHDARRVVDRSARPRRQGLQAGRRRERRDRDLRADDLACAAASVRSRRACRRPTSTAPCTRSRTRRHGPISGSGPVISAFTVRETRAGTQQILTHAARWDDALDKMSYWLPVIRAQALAACRSGRRSPRPSPVTSTSHGALARHQLRHMGQPAGPLCRQLSSTTSRRHGSTTRTSLAPRVTGSVPSSGIGSVFDPERRDRPAAPDHLAAQYDRDQAARATLACRSVSPIYLSGDWHHQLGGNSLHRPASPRTITGTGWILTLSSAPAQIVVGSVSPTVPARVWDSATAIPGPDESRTWNAA